VAFVRRVLLRGVEHHRCEDANAVRDTHEVHADHPLPILLRVLPDEPAGAHARVVEDEVRRTEAIECCTAHGFHLIALGHVEPERQHLGTQCLDLRRGTVQCVLLHVGHHDVHAGLGGKARSLEAEARCGAGDDGCLALERFHANS
jgi:hypothetical protein